MCAAIAREIGLGAHIKLGKQANDDGARDSDNILGDVMEALIGACFVTQGYGEARTMVRRLWAEAVTGHAGSAKHPKSELQEWAAMNRMRRLLLRRLFWRRTHEAASIAPGLRQAQPERPLDMRLKQSPLSLSLSKATRQHLQSRPTP